MQKYFHVKEYTGIVLLLTALKQVHVGNGHTCVDVFMPPPQREGDKLFLASTMGWNFRFWSITIWQISMKIDPAAPHRLGSVSALHVSGSDMELTKT